MTRPADLTPIRGPKLVAIVAAILAIDAVLWVCAIRLAAHGLRALHLISTP